MGFGNRTLLEVVVISLGIYQRNFLSFIGIYLMPTLVTYLGYFSFFGTLDLLVFLPEALSDESISRLLILLAFALIAGLFNLMVTAGIIGMAEQAYLKKVARMDKCFEIIFRKWAPLLGASILLMILVVAGFMLFIIPGVVLFIIFLYTFHVIVIENTGSVEGLKGSYRFLRNGNVLNTCLLAAFVFIITVLIGLFRYIPDAGDVIVISLTAIATPYFIILFTVAYIEGKENTQEIDF